MPTSCNNVATRLGHVLVLGLGRTGDAVARYLAGPASDRVGSVTLYGGVASRPGETTNELEALGVRVVTGTDDVEGSYDLCVASPGISERSAFFSSAASHASQTIGEPELAWRESPRDWLAITGTNGKTTTTALTRDLLRAGGYDAQEVGNIGTLAIGEVERRREGEWFVAELSSFQLATSHRMHPRAAALLNVTPDHLSWHGSLEAYAAAKERVFQNLGAGDLAVVSDGDAWCRGISARLEARGVRVCHLDVGAEPSTPDAAFVRAGVLVVRLDGVEHALATLDELPIKGIHNAQNALAASSLAIEVGVSPHDVRSGLLAFRALEHRIEPCGEVGGVRFVNDSKATNVDAVAKALTAFEPGRVVLLAGGTDKGTDLTDLAAAVAATCAAVVCYGQAGSRLAEAFAAATEDGSLRVLEAPHMADALEAAVGVARAGDTVLLSPACASFDEFSGFDERGRTFKELVARRVARAGEVA